MTETKEKAKVIQLSFGDTESVLTSSWLDYYGVCNDGVLFEPPFSTTGLGRARLANPHHGSCLVFRCNRLGNVYVANPKRPESLFKAASFDLLTFGYCFLQRIKNIFGHTLRYRHIPALNMRVKVEGGYRLLNQKTPDGYVDFDEEEIIFLKQYDPLQEVYGIPDWLPALQSLALNEAATLFRRRYYVNGAHLGYIFYSSDAKLDEETEDKLNDLISQGKGVGNFRSLFLHIPGGAEKAIQIIPVGDLAQKDEFERIKNISRDDVISSHRVHPALVAIRPGEKAQGGDGDLDKINIHYLRNETKPLAGIWLDANQRYDLQGDLAFEFDFSELDAQKDPNDE